MGKPVRIEEASCWIAARAEWPTECDGAKSHELVCLRIENGPFYLFPYELRKVLDMTGPGTLRYDKDGEKPAPEPEPARPRTGEDWVRGSPAPEPVAERVPRPYQLRSGFILCATCHQSVGYNPGFCPFENCPNRVKPWGNPRPLQPVEGEEGEDAES